MKLFVKKEKKAKDPLLQTYFMSLLSLVLCVAMFMGTSFAWFTSDVASTDNQIFVGTLKVGLHQSIDGANFTEVGQTATVAEGQPNNNLILDPDVRWEPGYTFMKWLKVENAGDLEFSYRLRMSAPASEALTILGQHFVVYANTADTITKPADFEALKQDAAWEEIGTLAEILAGKSIVNGKLDAKAKNATENPAKVFAFAIHMNENAPSEAMGKKLEGITVKLEAWQAAGGQTDSLGDQNYDNLITTTAELLVAFDKGGKAILFADIDMKGTTLVLEKGKALELDLNGHTVSGANGSAEYDSLVRVCNGAKLTVRDTGADGKLFYKSGNGNGGPVVHVEGVMELYSGTLAQEGNGVASLGVDLRPNAWSVPFESPCEFRMYGGKVDGGASQAIRVSVNSSESYAAETAVCEINGGEVVGKDALFLQMQNATYRPLSVTVNGGTIKGTVSAIRVFAPAPQKLVGVADGQKAVNITVNGGTFISQNNPATTDSWLTGNIVRVTVTGGELDKILEQVAFNNPNSLAAGNGQ